MAYKVIILYRLYMPSYFLGTFTEYPYYIQLIAVSDCTAYCPLYRLLLTTSTSHLPLSSSNRFLPVLLHIRLWKKDRTLILHRRSYLLV